MKGVALDGLKGVGWWLREDRRHRPDSYVRQRGPRAGRVPWRGLVAADPRRGARDAEPGRLRDRPDRRAADARRRRRRALGARCARGARGDGAQRRSGPARSPRQASHRPAAAAGGPAAPAHEADHRRAAGVAAAARRSSSSRDSEAGGSESSAATTRSRSPRCSRNLPSEPWYRAHGALVQELVPTLGFDLRIVVADDHVIGAISRVAAPGEWRTNVALGAERRQATPPPDACALALAAARATGASLVGVDLLPDGRGRWTVAEINGAVEFTTGVRARSPGTTRSPRPRSGSVGPRSAPGSVSPLRRLLRSTSRLEVRPATRSSTPLLDCDAARLRDCSAA